MPDCEFDDIEFKRLYFYKAKRYIKELIGIDSETTKRGKPFIFCTSLGESFTLNDLPNILFSRSYRNKNFAVWNLKFDSGSLIYNLPNYKKTTLWKEHNCTYKGCNYFYIPHKLLRISKGKNAVSFWDIMPFYKMSLNAAAKTYLKKSKIDIDPSKFTKSYIRDHLDTIRNYCIKDSTLTAELGNYLLRSLKDFKVLPNNLYSVASVSFAYFKNTSGIVNIHKIWEENKEVLKFAYEAYRGGKFEVTARGKFKGYVYDIKSAYPYEVMKLLNVEYAKVEYKKSYDPKATYGFLRVYIKNIRDKYHTVSLKVNDVNIYPCGSFNATITNEEYEYFRSLNIQIRIKEAWYLYIKYPICPYQKSVDSLFKIKEKHKKDDLLKSSIAKLMLNSFYGKMIQVDEKPDGRYIAAPGFNPIYAAIITANIRIAVTKIQNLLKEKCLAVHTDSVITTVKLPKRYLKDQLGSWELKEQGEGVIISNGIYQIANKCADRGFSTPPGFSWVDLLKQNLDKSVISVPHKQVMSWVSAAFRGNFEAINQFIEAHKHFELNNDSKRGWGKVATARTLLEGLEYSVPKFEFQVSGKPRGKSYGKIQTYKI